MDNSELEPAEAYLAGLREAAKIAQAIGSVKPSVEMERSTGGKFSDIHRELIDKTAEHAARMIAESILSFAETKTPGPRQ